MSVLWTDAVSEQVSNTEVEGWWYRLVLEPQHLGVMHSDMNPSGSVSIQNWLTAAAADL